jgi:hypothetical protein
MERKRILYYNARSLLSKNDEFRIVCEATKPDIVCIVDWNQVLNGDTVDTVAESRTKEFLNIMGAMHSNKSFTNQTKSTLVVN